jgi:predicted transcriptional regulator of viral defense system
VPSGITEKNRAHVDRLHQTVAGPFTVAEAARVLKTDLARTRRLLSWLENRGWLSRVRRGLYATVPLGARQPSEWREDPWVVATKVFDPCYIGGWTACEHWGLTEQVFRGVVVYTAKPVRASRSKVQGTPFLIRHAAPRKFFGLRPAWRDRVKTQVSDPSRTIVDVLDEPAIGGGIVHAAQVFGEYMSGEHRSDKLLLEYARRLGNGAVFKRLGYLIERMELDAAGVLAACTKHKTAGLAVLDPSVKAPGRIVRRWNLRVNVATAALGARM